MSGEYTTKESLEARSLGRMLRDLRTAKGEQLRKVAAAADMDPSLLSKIELGQRFPTQQQTTALARHFGVPPVQLEAARMEEEIMNKMTSNPEAAALVSARIAESTGEFRSGGFLLGGAGPAGIEPMATGAELLRYYRAGGSGVSEAYLDAVEEADKSDRPPDDPWA
jgi:transcriptional regulator with XRE-family HTH domain